MLLDDWHTSPKEKQTHQKMGTQSRGSKTPKGQDSLAANEKINAPLAPNNKGRFLLMIIPARAAAG